jgi:hypothetical protein
VLAPSGAARAQSFGLVGGATLGEINVSGDERANVVLTDKLEAAGGLFVAFPLGARASFAPEILVSNKGSQLAVAGVNERIRLAYAEVPLTFRLSPPPDSTLHWLRMVAGPYVAYLLDASSRPAGGGARRDVDDAFERADWGWVAGVGVEVGRLGIDARYNGGVADIGRRPGEALLPSSGDLKFRNRWFSFLGRYRF